MTIMSRVLYEGKRLRLRAPERSDIPRFVAWLNKPVIEVRLPGSEK